MRRSNYDGTAFMDKLASLPLLYQPGTVWDYGFGLDVLGLTIEKISGQSLGQYLQANLFAPLGMTDTGFSISAEKAARYARPLPADPDTGKPQARSPELTQPLKFECGGGCAASTASDYLRFALMLMNGGRCRRSAPARPADRRLHAVRPAWARTSRISSATPIRPAPITASVSALRCAPRPAWCRMMGSVGQFSWPGASGTDWWVDPKEELAVVYLSAAPGPIRWHYRQKINALVYQAIID